MVYDLETENINQGNDSLGGRDVYTTTDGISHYADVGLLRIGR